MNKENKNKKRDNPDIMNSEEKLDNKNQLKELRLEKKEKKKINRKLIKKIIIYQKNQQKEKRTTKK